MGRTKENTFWGTAQKGHTGRPPQKMSAEPISEGSGLRFIATNFEPETGYRSPGAGFRRKSTSNFKRADIGKARPRKHKNTELKSTQLFLLPGARLEAPRWLTREKS